MMQRRFLAGALAALPFMKPRPGAAPAPDMVHAALRGHVLEHQGNEIASAPGTMWAKIETLMRPSRAATRRHEITRLLLQGYPPHLATMHSMSPTLRAIRAAQWIQAREAEQASLHERTEEVVKRLWPHETGR